MLERYTVPGKYDVAPYGTVSKVIGDDGSYTIYVQLSKDEEHPIWVRSGDFLEKLFNMKIMSDEAFRKELFSEYQDYINPPVSSP